MSKQYRATLELDLACEDKDSAIDGLMEYLSECVRHDDATGFKIEEVIPSVAGGPEWEGGDRGPSDTEGYG